ncbi:outer membrane beta-barrel protein [Fulvivirgaceae bacterium BMA10]|uniref:Outer membrane beta-barrel protein n=1 Tax=Splendidivirga corallicola TaxID=3051826 RepID=A0ABT8KQB2_9BACT|nr:outer membrane beta-barrel protein [Fulvivirgaceae bacterium BMA10]
MKTKKSIVFLVVLGLFFSAYTVNAQIHFGATTSVNSTFVLDKGLSQDPRYNAKATYQWAPVGFSFGIDIGKRFGFQLESILAKQGQIFDVIDAAKNAVGERKVDLSYLQMPLFFKFMSGKDSGARTNFSFGPQLSILREGVETLQYDASVQSIPEGAEIPDGATLNPDGTYTVPALPTTELLSSTAEEKIRQFKETELQIAAAFGLDIDLSKHLYLSTVIRANYSFTDMRNGDLVDLLKDGNVSDLFSKRANLAVGAQLGLNFVIGGTRSYKAKMKAKENDDSYAR